ncbi:coiled-coil domain-containing protein 87 [Sorex fumeus]|uniref:coiled-coil domain-containing protein 87 n=1 Tax=Sorex fumeus TaxID=62283 RepID=UPI0024ADB568|nr:coiled-coil domain-containing protein 87 [Sorex fumeus]
MDPAKEESELRHLYHRMLRPLTLFPRREPLPEPQRTPPQDPVLPLPVSRLTQASLCHQVAKRLAQSGLTLQVSAEGRSHLTNVILDELKCGWWEPPPEPGLSHLDNQRLRKRLQAHVLLSSEQLFLCHLNMLATSETTSTVFTKNAMLVRLSASLSRCCTQFLTSPDVYRGLLADFRAQLQLEQAQGGLHKVRSEGSSGALGLSSIPLPCSTGIASVPLHQLNLNHLIKLSRPAPKELKKEPVQDPLKELMSIPQLKRKSLRFWPFLPKRRPPCRPLKTSPQPQAFPTRVPFPRAPTPSRPLAKLLVRKAESMPCLREGKRLSDFLGLPPFPSRPLSPTVLVAKSKAELAAGIVAKDLKQLVKNLKLEQPCSSPLHSCLDPLLGALTLCQVKTNRLKGLQEPQKELEEVTLASAQPVLPSTPEVPLDQSQPVTFTMKVNQGFVQGAAMLVSERSIENTYCVEGAGLLYNHLSGELEPRLLDKMKVEHFLGTSIREVYKELMNCVSSRYFSLEQESPGEEPALQTIPSAMLTSAFLFPKKQYAAINPMLAGIASYKVDPSSLSEDKMASFSSFQGLQAWGGYFQKLSWLSWWRATVSADDYFKYLYKEDTDFLHVIFHLYQEEVPKEAPPPVRKTPKIQHPPPLLQDEEPDFVPGEWNWGSLTEYSEQMERLLLDEPHRFLGLQERLEQLWSMLEVPAREQLDMAIKYSSNTHVKQLPSLVKAWEQALEHIRQRELLLGKLEWFERQASNPNRFFQKTSRSRRLLEESQVRDKLYRALRRMERPLTTILEDIEALFGEPVTFKGRSYLEKMKHDRVEMLFWLQQRRRIRQLVRAQKAKHRSQGGRGLRSQELTAPRNTPSTS